MGFTGSDALAHLDHVRVFGAELDDALLEATLSGHEQARQLAVEMQAGLGHDGRGRLGHDQARDGEHARSQLVLGVRNRGLDQQIAGLFAQRGAQIAHRAGEPGVGKSRHLQLDGHALVDFADQLFGHVEAQTQRVDRNQVHDGRARLYVFTHVDQPLAHHAGKRRADHRIAQLLQRGFAAHACGIHRKLGALTARLGAVVLGFADGAVAQEVVRARTIQARHLGLFAREIDVGGGLAR
jgi:hypothetical protein